MKYDFDTVINRKGSGSVKWDRANDLYKVSDVIPMWVADMDFKSPPAISRALKKTADWGIFGYTLIPDSYCESIIGWMKKRHGWDIQKEWLVYTPGVVPALRLLVKTFTQPGDQVIAQTPVYYPFFATIKDNGCELLENPLRLQGEQYVMDLEDLESKVTSRTKLIILCSPHNPISRVWKADELKRLGELCVRHKILVVSDEIHSDIVYRGFKHIPFPAVSDEFGNNCVVCTAASKTFNLPGLRTSNIIVSNPELRKRFTDTMRNCGMAPPNMFGIAATEAAYRHGEEWLKQLLTYLQGNIQIFRQFISAHIPGLKIIQPQGTYLLWLDFRACDVDMSQLESILREKARIGLEAGEQFGCKEPGFRRMNIACSRITLEEAMNRLANAFKT